jgi:hypothetical protein
MKTQLDFRQLPSVTSTSILEGLDRDIEREIQHLPETLDRARGAAVLFHCASAQNESWRDEAFIRAGLADFKSMEESLSRDLREADNGREPHRFRASRNPLVHLMCLLRDVNIHASRSKTDITETTVVSTLGEPHRYTYKVSLIINLSPEQLLAKREVRRRYDKANLRRMVTWFEENQCKFGAPDLLVRGVECFCSELLEIYGVESHNTRLQRTAGAAR